jgi:hypothetical protein
MQTEIKTKVPEIPVPKMARDVIITEYRPPFKLTDLEPDPDKPGVLRFREGH